MPRTARERAMIRQYERCLKLLQDSVNRSIMSDSDVPPLAWWEDESTRHLTLQVQEMRKQLPEDYQPRPAPPPF